MTKKAKYAIPETLIPEGNICVPLFIPDDETYVRTLLRHMRLITADRNYVRDDNNSALIVREQWRQRTINPLVDALYNGDFCCDENATNTCFRLYADSIGVQFLPNSPFLPLPEDVTELSQLGIWSTFDNELEKFPKWIETIIEFFYNTPDVMNNIGYGRGDIFVSPPPEKPLDIIGSLSQFIDFFADVLTGDTPRVRIDLIGTGGIEIELLSIPSGGSAIVVVDDVFSIQALLDAILNQDATILSQVTIVELQRDIVQFPPETIASVQIPITLSGDANTAHNVKIFFIPRFDDQLTSFQGYGGGFRRIDICGDLRVINPETGAEISINNYGSQTNKQRGIIMGTVEDICAGMICAMETLAQRILLAQSSENIRSSIEVDSETGAISIKTTTIDNEPDILDTSALERACGAAKYQAAQFAKLFTDMNQRITDGFSVATIQSLVSFFLNPLEETVLNALVNTYFTDNPALTINVDNLAESIYCNGDFYSGVREYAISLNNEANLNRIINFSKEISPQTLSKWYDEGLANPRTDYLDYSCTIVPVVNLSMDFTQFKTTSGVSIPYAAPSTAGRLYRFEVIADFVSSTGETYDGLYYKSATGVITQYVSNHEITPTVIFPQEKPGYQNFTNGRYVYHGIAANNGTIMKVISNSTVRGKDWISGNIDIRVYDLGENT